MSRKESGCQFFSGGLDWFLVVLYTQDCTQGRGCHCHKCQTEVWLADHKNTFTKSLQYFFLVARYLRSLEDSLSFDNMAVSS